MLGLVTIAACVLSIAILDAFGYDWSSGALPPFGGIGTPATATAQP